VPDKDDQCPEQIGPLSSAGCPDLDEDGVPDKDDHCPETKGVASYKGCPAIDRDKDGISDAEDLCPDMSGQARWKGCPDTDNDGLPDNKDGCPGISGPENLKGCPDTDLDGIADKDDECPTIKGLLDKKGCPETLPPALGVPYKAVYFGSTLEEWHTTSMATLNEVVNILNSDPAMFARLEGHTDNTGREPANDLLSEKRAKKCLDYLISKGIDANRLNYLGFGSQRPIVPNTTRENKQLNRRVEVYFYKK
jgi:outer membrane protein OmpA-like peptidoglycan-associated protein